MNDARCVNKGVAERIRALAKAAGAHGQKTGALKAKRQGSLSRKWEGAYSSLEGVSVQLTELISKRMVFCITNYILF